MSFSYNDFVQLVKSDGLAYQNRFYINIGLPRKLYGASSFLFNSPSSTANRNLHLLCKGITINGVNVATAQTRLTGEVYDLPYDRNFSGASIQFYVDKSLIVRQFFEDWVHSIQDPDSRVLSWYDDYVSTIEIFIENKSQRQSPTYKFILNQAFPKQIGALSLDQDATGIMILNVEFDFHNYRTEFAMPSNIPQTITGLPSGAISSLPTDVISKLPGLPSLLQNEAFSGIINPISALYTDATTALQDLNNNFRSFQEYVSNGIQTLNDLTGIPVQSVLSGDIRNIGGRAKEYARTTMRAAGRRVLGSVFGDAVKIKTF